jgi:PAS domain S-box-containing protein
MSIKDLDGRFRVANRWIETTYGRPAELLRECRADDIDDTPAAQAIRDMEREVAATGEVVAREVKFERADRIAWHYVVKFPIRNGTGDIVGIGAIGIDITERRQAEQALLASESRFRSFMDHAPVEMVVKDCEGRYQFISRGVEQFWGKSKAEILGRKASEFSQMAGVDALEALDREVVATARMVAREVHFPDLADSWLYKVSFPIKDQNGAVAAVGGIGVSIAELKRTERDLIKARDAAELANRAKSQFMANMSHELRTPLNAIIGFADLLISQHPGTAGSQKDLEYLQAIQSSGGSLLDIVNTILLATQIEGGMIEPNGEPCDVAELAESTIRACHAAADRKNVALDGRVATDLPAIVVDERLFKKILLNLLSNAVKFTPDGGRVALDAGISSSGGLSIVVSDNGIGIAPGEASKAFDRFSQIDGSYARQHGGIGLGLFIAKRLTELHDGSIAIEQADGGGTRVTLALPPDRWCRPLPRPAGSVRAG